MKKLSIIFVILCIHIFPTYAVSAPEHEVITIVTRIPLQGMNGSATTLSSEVTLPADTIPLFAKTLARTLIEKAPPLILCVAGASLATTGIKRSLRNKSDKKPDHFSNGLLTLIGGAAFGCGWYLLTR